MEENGAKKKLVIGWFSFTCCEDSTILLTEILNDHFDEWKKVVEFRHVKALKTDNRLEDLDVAFIEGAVSSDTDAKEVKEIRENSKMVVAIGNCACTGLPSASRNQFKEEDMTDRIKWYFENFDYSEKVRKLEDVIKVDAKVLGCPMKEEKFLETVNFALKEFNIV